MDINKKIEDSNLDNVNGGINNTNGAGITNVPTKVSYCPKCETNTVFYLYSGGRAICKDCEYEKFM